jgi:hypothetical protein
MNSRAPLQPGRGFLGQGLAFPLRVTPHGRLATARAEAKIEQSVWLILSTALGERVMQPTYGCGAHDMLFEPNNPTSVGRLVDFVRQALTAQEPRIAVLDIEAETSDSDPSAVMVRIDYRIQENNSIANLVYPFFVREGA